ncbi:unnamed protein product [Phaedon cochleariae]|uniref:Amino acid transporter transmembrane domain-containing protein n=1 Tax=Phaedon cochleariae TaxID=80249 RepID=A0A9N9SI42_PHACE|nr:unnamed protein product [Phaedon cochleariae]
MSENERRVFKQDNCSSDESENDTQSNLLGALPFSIQKTRMRGAIPSYGNIDEKHLTTNGNENIYDVLQKYSNLDDAVTENTRLLPVKKVGLEDSFQEIRKDKTQTNSSLVTIFAVWNTTMGSSLLAMAWGIEKSGLFPGILINIIIAGLCTYTAYILLSINAKHGVVGQNFEVSDLCGLLVGRWAEVVSKIFSLIVLIGGDIVYWILMSNFLYNFVYFLHGYLTGSESVEIEKSPLCLKENILGINETNILPPSGVFPMEITVFDKVWDLYSTVPVFLAVITLPLLNFKSPTFFTKFNSLGTFSVGYLLIFVAIKSVGWGVHIQNWSIEFDLKPTFCVLSGMLSMSYFIHNIIISVMRHNKHQEQNGRDLTIAFGLVTFTYLFIGTAFYITFPLAKTCIEDNLLNNFPKSDTMAMVARLLLFFQLFTVFPLVTFMLRTDIFSCASVLFKNKSYREFSYAKAILVNCFIVFVCIMFACFLPKIGTLIRYTGAMSGLIYVFLMPSLLKVMSLRKEGALTATKLMFFVAMIFTGFLNLISQFFIVD